MAVEFFTRIQESTSIDFSTVGHTVLIAYQTIADSATAGMLELCSGG